ncbi:MAG: hypothetical protein MUO77_08355 [Anaerolineales bacterium]|nr:hypothetical protein [Anaerolineales bacterium]
MPIQKSPPLELDDLLAAEYNYIADTAGQANEDRARVASFYLIAVGSLVAALFSTRLIGPDFDAGDMNLLFSGLFFTLTLLGTTTVVQLARLRSAWYESMLAMNQIKEYVISKDKELSKAYRWRSKTLPPLYKVNSISYQQTFEVAILSGLMFGASVYFFQKGLAGADSLFNWIVTCGLGILAFVSQLYIYKRLLKQNK